MNRGTLKQAFMATSAGFSSLIGFIYLKIYTIVTIDLQRQLNSYSHGHR